MKNLIIVLFIIGGSIMLLESCSSDITGADISEESFLTGVVNQDEEVFYVRGDLDAYATNVNSTFDVCGIVNRYTQKYMYIRLPLDFELGTHMFSDEIFAIVTEGNKSWSTLVGNGNGRVTIESVDDKRYTGTFSFVAFDHSYDNINRTMSVTNGRFDVLRR